MRACVRGPVTTSSFWGAAMRRSVAAMAFFADSTGGRRSSIARHHLAEADEWTVRVLIVIRHYPHRATPGDIGAAIEQGFRRLAHGRRRFNADIDTFTLPIAPGNRKVERHIRDGPQVFEQGDRFWHRGRPRRAQQPNFAATSRRI